MIYGSKIKAILRSPFLKILYIILLLILLLGNFPSILYYFYFNYNILLIISILIIYLLLIIAMHFWRKYKLINSISSAANVLIIILITINMVIPYYLSIIIYSAIYLIQLASLAVILLPERLYNKYYYFLYLMPFLTVTWSLRKTEYQLLAPLIVVLAILLWLFNTSFNIKRYKYNIIWLFLFLPIYPLMAFYFLPERPAGYEIGKQNGVRLVGIEHYENWNIKSLEWRTTSRSIAVDENNKYLFVGSGKSILRIDMAHPSNILPITTGAGNAIVVDDTENCIYVLDDSCGCVKKINYITLKTLSTIKVKDPFNPFQKNNYAFITIRMSPDRKYLFVLTDKFLYRISIPELSIQSMELGGFNNGIDFDIQKRKVILSNNNGIASINMDRMEITRTDLLGAGEISVDYLHRKILLSKYYSKDATIFDMDSEKIINKIPVGLGCRFQTYDPVNDICYLANYARGYLLIIDPDCGKIIGKVDIGRRARCLFIHPKTGNLFTSTSIGLVEIDLKKIIKK